MEKRKISLVALILVLVISSLQFIPLDKTYAYDLPDDNNFTKNSLENVQCYYDHIAWEGGGEHTLAIAFMNGTSLYVAWYDVSGNDPANTELTPYNIQFIHTGVIECYSLIEYINDEILIAYVLDTGAGVAMRPNLLMKAIIATNSTYSAITTIQNYALNVYDNTGTPEPNHSLSNIVKLGNEYWICVMYTYEQTGFRYYNQYWCSSVGDADREIVWTTSGATYNEYYMILASGSYLGSLNNRVNELYLVTKYIAGSDNSSIWAYNGFNNTLREICNLGSHHPTELNTKSANWVASMGWDYDSGFIGTILYSYQHTSGEVYLTAVKWSDNVATGINEYTIHGYAEGGGVYPSGCYDDLGTPMSDYLSRIVYGGTYSFSKITINTYSFSDTTLDLGSGIEQGYFGLPIQTTINLAYQNGQYYRLEVDSSNNLHVYTTTLILPQPPSIDYTLVTVGSLDPDGLNTTYTGLNTYLYLADLQNIEPSKLTEISLGFSGNATDRANYKVALGLYYAPNTSPISTTNPLTLIYAKEYSYIGASPSYNQIVDYPNINIPPNSIVGVAYASTCDLLVNTTYSLKQLYRLNSYMPSTATYLYDEGNKDLMLYAKFLSQSGGEEEEIVPEAPYVIDITRTVLDLSSWLGFAEETFGIILWIVAIFVVMMLIAMISTTGANIPSFVYFVMVIAVTFVFHGIGYIPIWYTVLISLAVIGVAALSFSRIATGGE